MKTLKITKENLEYLKSGLKIAEIRAFEDVGDGGEFMLVDSITGQELAKIELKLIVKYDKSSCNFGKHFRSETGLIFGVAKEIAYMAQTPFWSPWVKHYLDKNETPAFYQVFNLDVINND